MALEEQVGHVLSRLKADSTKLRSQLLNFVVTPAWILAEIENIQSLLKQ